LTGLRGYGKVLRHETRQSRGARPIEEAMPRLAACLISLAMLGGCGGKSPPDYAAPEAHRLEGDVGRCWEAVLRVLAERGYEIERADRESGIIETRWRVVNAEYSSSVFVTQGEDRYSDCGKPGLGKTFQGKQARFVVRLAPVGDQKTDAAAQAAFRTERVGGFSSPANFQECRSRGRLEDEVLIETQVRMLTGRLQRLRQQGR